MAQVINPTTIVKVVPRDGELEVTLNIHITLEGKVLASSENAKVEAVSESEDEDAVPLIPDFSSGTKILNFDREID